MTAKQKTQQPAPPAHTPAARQTATPTADQSPLAAAPVAVEVAGLPNHPTARGLRQAAVAQMQQRQGNGYVQRKVGPPTAVMRRATPGGAGLSRPAGDAEAQSEPAVDLSIRPALAAAPPAYPPNGNGNGNGRLQPLPPLPGRIQRQEEENDTPTEEEKAIALAEAAEAEREAGQARDEGESETDTTRGKAQTEAAAGRAGKEKAAAEKDATPPPKDKEPAEKPAPAEKRGRGGDAAGQDGTETSPVAAPAPAVAGGAVEEGKAPASPQDDPAFQKVTGTIKGAATREKAHAPAATKAAEAQAAAEAPAAEIAGRAQANQTTKMEQAETPAFDAAGLKARLMQRIQELAPKTAGEASDFKKNNKLAGVQSEMRGQVSAEKDKSQAPTTAATRQAPDLAAVPPKPVEPLAVNAPGPAAPDVGAAAAAPKTKTRAEIEAPLEAESKGLDQQMADADITPEQLARGNEPEFQAALDAKAEAQTHAATAPAVFRQGERDQLSQAEAGAVAVAQEKTQAMHGDRAQLLAQVDTKQQKGKSADEKARQDVGANIQRLFDETKTKVETILGNLDREVGDVFTPGAEAAKQAFEAYVDAKMKAYKKKRYGGFFGWARWGKDRLAGMPSAVNVFYVDGRQLFLNQMDAVINNVVALIGRRLAEAKAEIAAGKKRITEYVNGLPEALQSVGRQATEEIDGRFDHLEADVNSKQDQLIDSLAQQYQTTLKAVDARIEELKAANRGFVEKAYDAMAGVAKAVWRLKDLLFEVLARVAEVVTLIIHDPIGFLENMIRGVRQGFNNFVEHIETHLQDQVVTWLTGEMGNSGIDLPDNLEPANMFDLALQLLGITAESVRARAVNMLGEDVVAALEQGFDMFMLLKEQGLAGLWQFVQEQLGNLKDTLLDGIKSMLITEVIKAGVKWLLGLLGGPAGAFIKACQAIYDIVMWFFNNAERLKNLIDAVLDGIAAVARGAVDDMAQRIEDALAQVIPIAISFLASLLGLKDLGQKVRRVVERVKTPANKAIDWVLGKALAAARRLGRMVGIGQEPVAAGAAVGAPVAAGGPAVVGTGATAAVAGRPVAAGAVGAPVAGGATTEGQATTDAIVPIHEEVMIGTEHHTLDSLPNSYELVLHSPPPALNLLQHPNEEVVAAYKHYLNKVSQATSPTARQRLARQLSKPIVAAIRKAGLSKDPGASAPGLGVKGSHGAKPSSLRNGPKLWHLESEHILPYAVGMYLWRLFAKRVPKRGRAVDRRQTTLMIYKGAADKKTAGDRGDIDLFKQKIAEYELRQEAATRFGVLGEQRVMGDEGALDRGREDLELVLAPLQEAKNSAVSRTNAAIAQEWAKKEPGNQKTNGERRAEDKELPNSGQVEEAAEEQYDSVLELATATLLEGK